MSTTIPKMNGLPITLLPHQAALVETVLDPSNKRITLLDWDVGLGKTVTLVALAGRLLREEPTARVLFVGPTASVKSQVVDRLRRDGIANMPLDRYRFREMLDSPTSGALWPTGTVVVLTYAFARQPDIRDCLVESHWDLLILDEVRAFRGANERLLTKLGASAQRVVVATATPHAALYSAFPPADVCVVACRRGQVVDQDGVSLDRVPRPLLQETRFPLTSAELHLRQTVHDLARQLFSHSRTGPYAWRAMLLLQSLESSQAALERVLLSRRDDLLQDEEWSDIDKAPEIGLSLDDDLGQDLDKSQDRSSSSRVSDATERALEEIEAISEDSKLGAFQVLLNTINKPGQPCKRICVVTEYLATLYYLAAAMEDQGTDAHLFHGGMSAVDRQQSLARFVERGGVLAATRALMTEGLDVPEVSDLVLYDSPLNPVSLQQLLGRFDRFGRVAQLHVHVLVPSNAVDALITGRLLLLRKVLDAAS